MILFWFWFQFLKRFFMISCCNRSFPFFPFFCQVILASIEWFLSLSVFIGTHEFVCRHMWLWNFYCISKILLLKKNKFSLAFDIKYKLYDWDFLSFCFLVKHGRFRFLFFHQYGRFYIQKKLHFHAMSLMDVSNHESP